MLERLLENTVEVSLASAVIILLLLLLTPFLNRTYTAKWRYWLWMVLALRLAIPFNLSLPQAPVRLPIPEHNFTYSAPAPASPSALPPSGPADLLNPAVTAAHSVSLNQIAALLWIAGIAVFLAYSLIGALVFRHSVLRWAKDIHEGPIPSLFEGIANEMKLRKGIRIAYCRKVGSPMMTGLFHPILLLPEEEYSEENLRFILRHELIHYRRQDIWYKLLMLIANAVHWFNPLVYFMVRMANQDIEISCDEEVLKGADFDSRRRYGDAIMSVIHSGKGRRTVFSTYFKGGKQSMKQRFSRIFDTRAKKRGAVALCVVLAVACTAGGLVAFRKAGTKEGALPFSLGETPVSMPDGSVITVELRMTAGESIPSDSPDFVPGGGFTEGDNYCGSFELVSRRDGAICSSTPLDFGEDSDQLVFHGPVSFQFADYNGDGYPELTIGSWLWSGGNQYNLYSVGADGTLSLLAQSIRHDSTEASVLFHPRKDGGFAVDQWNQLQGDYSQVSYRWDGSACRYIASTSSEPTEVSLRSVTIETQSPSGSTGRDIITDHSAIDAIIAILQGAEAVSEDTRVIFPAGGSSLEFYFSSGEHISVSAGQIGGTECTILQLNGVKYRLSENVFSELRRQYGSLDNPQSGVSEPGVGLPVHLEAEQIAIRQAVDEYYAAFQRDSGVLSSLEVNSVTARFQSAADADVSVNYTITASRDNGDFIKGTYPVDDLLRFRKTDGSWSAPALMERSPHPDGPAYSLLNYLTLVLGEEEYGGGYVTEDNKLAIWTTDQAAAEQAIESYNGIQPPGVEYLATGASIAQLRQTAMEFQASSLQPVKDLATVNVDTQLNRIRFGVRGKDAAAEWNKFIKGHPYAAYIVIEEVGDNPAA